MGRQRTEPGPGQESVWDYPRPPRLEDSERRIKVVFGGVTLAYTTRANTRLAFGADGVSCRIEMPLAARPGASG